MNRTLLSLTLTVVWLLTVVACGGGDGVGGDVTSPDPGTLDPGAVADAADVKPVTDLEVTIVFPDYGQDQGGVDGEGDTGDGSPDQGVTLEECGSGDDCPSGICVEDADGVKYCAPPCLDQDCPEGWKCAQVTTSGDTAFVCLPAAQYLCRPCEDHDDCAPAGLLSTDRCVEYGPVGRFCGKDCQEDGECPDGYTCAEIPVREGESMFQCVQVTGLCECNDEFVTGGFVTACYLENEFGRCEGLSQCGAQGMTPCTASTPADEACNGQDDNCDGTTDEGIEAVACEKAFGEYVCQGLEVCEGGSLVCDAPEPAEEKCDGVDNDCDGITDEPDAEGCTKYYLDQDDDSYGMDDDFKCLCGAMAPYGVQVKGDCDDANPNANPGAAEACDGADNDCDGLTDEEDAVGCVELFRDMDADGFGGIDDSKCLCASDADYTMEVGGDCNDGNPDVFLGAVEICNGLDDDCNGVDDDEDAVGCLPYHLDADDDGYGVDGDFKCLCGPAGAWSALEPGDCDDASVAANPGMDEVCNGGVDDDCDGDTDEENAQGCQVLYEDLDGDDFGVPGAEAFCLCGPNPPIQGTQTGDCDDDNAFANPDQTEKCGNGLDDDCDGITDEEGGAGCQDLYRDEDDDGFGVTGDSKCLCGGDGEYTAPEDGDCNDGDPDVFPGQLEACNEKDDDCNGQTDEENADGCTTFYFDGDGDAYGLTGNARCLCDPDGKWEALQGGDCNDSDMNVYPSATELCNGKEDDCDGEVDEEGAVGCQEHYYDGDEDGYGVTTNSHCLCELDGKFSALNNGDCDDGNDAVNPGATEACNAGMDDDCDGQTDEEDAGGCETWYLNGDGDGYGDGTQFKCLCAATGQYDAQQAGDCDDGDPTTWPGAPESCNGVDDDCDGDTDESWPTKGQECDGPDDDLCLEGLVECTLDGTGVKCSDTTLTDAEKCNNQDDDCDGQTDEGFPNKGQPCDGFDTDQCQEGTWVCNGTTLECSDTSGNSVESCNNLDDDCDGSTDESLNQPCSSICGSGIETCISGGWFNCTAQQPITCTNYLTCNNEPMCTGNCPSAPPESCNDKDDDCDGQTDENWWNSDYSGGDYPDNWYGPNLYNCLSESCQGTTSGRILPEGDEDWLSVYKSETNDWSVDLKGMVWFNGPAISNVWYEVCICWTQNSVCDASSKVCGVSQGGSEVILQANNGDSWGSDDAAYLDVQVTPSVASLDFSCTPWSLTWSVWE